MNRKVKKEKKATKIRIKKGKKKKKEKDIDKKALESINKEELTGKSKKVYEYLEKNPEIAKQVILKIFRREYKKCNLKNLKKLITKLLRKYKN